MAFTDFFCNASTGDNAAAGSTAGAVVYTSTNGNWDGTSIFTPASGNPSLSVAVGDFCSVFNDGATVAVYVARVTAVSSTTITLSTTAKAGTAPTSSATGRSVKVGGAWLGPNGTSGFPFGFITATLTNASGDVPRVNLKNNTTYSITAAMTHNVNGPGRFQGYTTSPGDGGRATIDGGTSGASYVLLTSAANNLAFYDLILQNNGATGSADGFSVGGNNYDVSRVVVNSVRGDGLAYTGTQLLAEECEAYSCNQSNTANKGGFSATNSGTFRRCVSHDHSGGNAVGFRQNANVLVNWDRCIADTCGSHGFSGNGNPQSYANCDAYNNGGSGISSNATDLWVENCNLVKNGAYGVNCSGAVAGPHGYIRNCGFGSGTQANTSGQTNGTASVEVSGSVTYAADVTPWNAPATGDFTITLAAAKGAGRGTFTQTQASYTGAVGYPDIGAAQSRGGGISRSRIIGGV